VLSFIIDLTPAVHTKHTMGMAGGQTEMQIEANDGVEGRDNVNGNGYRSTRDSERTLGANDVRYPKDGVSAGRNF